MKAVMYHYVRPSNDRPPYEYYYLDLDDFRAQLDHFESEYDLLDRETFRSCLENGTQPPEDGLVLTFDDGLIDHYEWVLPELDSRDLWGVFFVSGPLDRPLPVHRIHVLLGVADAEALLDALFEIVDEDDVLDRHAGTFRDMYEGFDSADSVNQLKRVLNYLLPYDRLPSVLDDLESRFPRADAVEVEDLYATPDQLRELARAGNLLGAHTVTHPVLSRLSPDEQRRELVDSLEYVDSLVDGSAPRLFAYPYGGSSTFDDGTVETLQAIGCDAAFTTESGDVAATDVAERPYRLRRRDCNEFPHGGASRY